MKIAIMLAGILEIFVQGLGELILGPIFHGLCYLTGRAVMWIVVLSLTALAAIYAFSKRTPTLSPKLTNSGSMVGGITGLLLTGDGFTTLGLSVWIVVGLVFLARHWLLLHNGG